MKTELRRLVLSLILLMCCFVIPSFAAIHQNTAKIRMIVSADIPDIIRISGLPSTVTLKEMADGTVESDMLEFSIERTGASERQEKQFVLAVNSTHGQEGKKYHLRHDNGTDSMFVHAGLATGTAKTVNGLVIVPTSGIHNVTHASPEAGAKVKRVTHSLAFFNRDAQYMRSRAAGHYSANFTIMVKAQ